MQSSNEVIFSVVVVNFNGAEFILDCLESLEQQHVTKSEVEILVVDNASTDGSAELVQQHHPAITLIRSEVNLGFGGGVNLGVSAAAGRFVVLLNSDATADPGFLAAITAPLLATTDGEADDRIAAVTARMVLTGHFVRAPADRTDAYVSATGERWVRTAAQQGAVLLNSTGSQVSRSGNARDRSWLAEAEGTAPPAEVFGFCGGAAALRRSALEQVGGFDQRLFMYYEDVDLSWRLRRAGWSVVYAQDAVVHHRHAGSSGIRSRLFLVHNVRNRILVTARNGPPAMLAAALVRTAANVVRTSPKMFARRSGADARAQVAASVTALARLLPMLPGYLRDGRRRDRTAVLPRDAIYAWAVADGSD